MIATILTIIAYLLPLIVAGVKGQRETIKGNDHDANVQDFRKALNKSGQPQGIAPTNNDIDAALADQHDRVQQALRGS